MAGHKIVEHGERLATWEAHAMRWPIRWQVLIPFAAVTAIALSTVTLIDAQLAANRAEAQIAAQLAGVARTLRDARYPLTDEVLSQMAGLSGAEFLLLDARGRVTAASRQAASPVEPLPPERPIGERPFELDAPVEWLGDRYYQASIEVPPRGTAAGPLTLHILFPERALASSRRAAALPHLLFGAVALAAVAGLSLLLALRIARPLQQVTLRVADLAEGAYEPIPLPRRNDELRDLVAAVNKLAARLEESRHAIRRAERLSLLGRLSSGMAHSLRNHIAGATLAVQLHQRHCSSDDGDSLHVALRQMQLTESHLKRFLAAGRPSEPRFAVCRLGQIVDDVVELVQPACRHRRIELQVQVATAANAALRADRDLLGQALLNVVLNGIEAAGTDGWVRIECAAAEGTAVLQFLDGGPGPPPEVRPRLFEPFVTSKPEGVGLGLIVARQIVEAHGGLIALSPQAPPTCFEVALPLAAVGPEPWRVPGEGDPRRRDAIVAPVS
jgi:signal transduction histidine kinase